MAGPRRLLAVLGSLGLVVAACGGSDGDSLDTARAERLIRQTATTQYAEYVRIGPVECPDDVPQRRGENFACTVTIGGMPLRVVVTQTDDEGRVSVQQAQAVLVTEDNETFVAEYARDNGQATRSVDCGDTPVVVRDRAGKVECRVTLPDGTVIPAVIGVRDIFGNTALISFGATKPDAPG